MAKWYTVCDKITGDAISFCTDDSQGFDLAALQAKFDVNPIVRQPVHTEKYDKTLKAIVDKLGFVLTS